MSARLLSDGTTRPVLPSSPANASATILVKAIRAPDGLPSCVLAYTTANWETALRDSTLGPFLLMERPRVAQPGPSDAAPKGSSKPAGVA